MADNHEEPEEPDPERADVQRTRNDDEGDQQTEKSGEGKQIFTDWALI